LRLVPRRAPEVGLSGRRRHVRGGYGRGRLWSGRG
jgi:hypothetical protein